MKKLLLMCLLSTPLTAWGQTITTTHFIVVTSTMPADVRCSTNSGLTAAPTTAYINAVAATLEDVWTSIVVSSGFRLPPGTVAAPTSDAQRITIVIQDRPIGSFGETSVAVSVAPIAPPIICIDDNYSEFGWTTSGADSVNTVLPHEFLHASQQAYVTANVYNPSTLDWIWEGTGAWIEDEFPAGDPINTYLDNHERYARHFSSSTHVSLDQRIGGLKYSPMLFYKHLSERGISVRQWFENLSALGLTAPNNAKALAALGDAIKLATGSRSPFDIYGDFSAAVVAKSGPSGFQDDGASQLPDVPSVAVSTQSDANAHTFVYSSGSQPIPHLSSRYITVAQPSLLDRPSIARASFKVPGIVESRGILIPVAGTATLVSPTSSSAGRKFFVAPFGVTRSSPAANEIAKLVLSLADVSPSRDSALTNGDVDSQVAPQFHEVFTPDSNTGTTSTVQNGISSKVVQLGTFLKVMVALSAPPDTDGISADFSALDAAFNPANVMTSTPTVTSSGTFITITYPLSYAATATSGEVLVKAVTTLAGVSPFTASDNSFSYEIGGPWGYVYDATTLPDAITPASFGWTRNISGTLTDKTLAPTDGILELQFIRAKGSGNIGVEFLRGADPVLASNDLTIEFKTQTLTGAGSGGVGFVQGQRFGGVTFVNPTTVVIDTGEFPQPPIVVSISSEVFHVYRVTRDANSFQVYIDGTQVAGVATIANPNIPASMSTLNFYGVTSNGGSYRGLWDYVAYTQGSFSPGALASPSVDPPLIAPGTPTAGTGTEAVVSGTSISPTMSVMQGAIERALAFQQAFASGTAINQFISSLDKKGGSVKRPDGVGVDIPSGALQRSLPISVSVFKRGLMLDLQREQKRLKRGLLAVSDEAQYGPEGTTFSVPAALVLPYDSAALASSGLKESNLKIYYWNGANLDWEPLDSTVDAVNHTVSAAVNHFSLYQVLASPGASSALTASATPQAAVSAFGLINAYAFPNPVRGQNTVTIRVQPGQADTVEVRVYDLSGRKVHASSSFNNLGAFDDGNGLGAQFTYDHIWDVSGAGSGVYTYAVTAKKAGQADIVKSGKVAVVK